MAITNGFNLISVLLCMHIVMMLGIVPFCPSRLALAQVTRCFCGSKNQPLPWKVISSAILWIPACIWHFYGSILYFFTSGTSNTSFFLPVSAFYSFCTVVMNRAFSILYSAWQSTAETFASVTAVLLFN